MEDGGVYPYFRSFYIGLCLLAIYRVYNSFPIPPREVRMKKSFADQCLERAEGIKGHKLRVTALVPKDGIGTAMSFYLSAPKDVPELAWRLKMACEALREYSNYISNVTVYPFEMRTLADELEALPIDTFGSQELEGDDFDLKDLEEE